MKEQLKNSQMVGRYLRGRPAVLGATLRILEGCNEHYRGICSGLQLDDLKDLHKQLIDSADWLSNVEQIEHEEIVADHVAKVFNESDYDCDSDDSSSSGSENGSGTDDDDSSSSESEDTSGDDDSMFIRSSSSDEAQTEPKKGKKEAVVSHVMVTSRSAIKGTIDGTEVGYVRAIADSIPLQSLSSNDVATATIKKIRQTSLVPVNEFTENQALISGVFPHLFPLGFVSKQESGSLSKEEIHFMFRQFTNVHASEERLLFLLFNQMQRHKAAQSVSAK